MPEGTTTYFAYARNADEVRRVGGKLTRGATVFAYTTEQAAHDHCWMRNSVKVITKELARMR